MDMFRYRAKARIVAIVDLIISSMSLCICLILLLGAVILSTSPTNPDDERAQFAEMQKEQTKKMLITFIWVMVVFTSITTIIQIVAAVKLLNATQLGKDPVGALKLCVFWRHVCIVFTILLLITILFNRVENSSSIFMVIQVLLRASAIYIVTQFMKELDTAITSGVLPMYCPPGSAPIIAGVAYAYVPQQQQQQAAYNPDLNAAPPSYNDVVKEPPPPMKQ